MDEQWVEGKQWMGTMDGSNEWEQWKETMGGRDAYITTQSTEASGDWCPISGSTGWEGTREGNNGSRPT